MSKTTELFSSLISQLRGKDQRTNMRKSSSTANKSKTYQENQSATNQNHIVATPFLEEILNSAPRNEQGDLVSHATLLEMMVGHCKKSDNQLYVSEKERNWVAVLQIKQPENAVVIICTRQYSTSPEFFSLRAILNLDSNYRLVRIIFAEAGAILSSYSQAEESIDVDLKVTQINSQSGSLFLNIVRQALQKKGATDIHIEVKNKGSISHRIDGRVITLPDTFPPSALISVCGYAYTQLASANSRSSSVFSRSAPQSCLIELNLDGQPVRMRYQHTPLDNNGLKCVLRILPMHRNQGSKVLTSLHDLGYTVNQVHAIQLATRTAFGAFILSGITGSGKSTTIKSALETDPNRDSLITYTIEDPVEYSIEGVAQIPIQRARAGHGASVESRAITYAEMIVALLRMDPDRIVPGEVRDNETAKAVETAVLTGHQVLTTVHASSALSIIDRLSSDEIGLSRQTLSLEGFISGLLYQRLMPKNCVHCSLPSVQVEEAALLQLIESKYEINPESFRSRNKAGCSNCHFGISGLKVAAEIILPGQYIEFLKYIRNGDDTLAREIWRNSRTARFDEVDMTGKSAMEHAIYDMTQGIIDPRIIEDSFVPFELAHVWK